MSLNPQRLASIGLVGAALGGLAWSEFSGKPVGPSSATAAPEGESHAAAAAVLGSQASNATRDDFRILLAGTLRDYANANSLEVSGIQDPFIEPASWTSSPVIQSTEAVDAIEVVEDMPAAPPLVLTAVLDAPTGPVARVNGVLLVVGKPTPIAGYGTVELVEVGTDGRSASIKTQAGLIRVELTKVIGVPGA